MIFFNLIIFITFNVKHYFYKNYFYVLYVHIITFYFGLYTKSRNQKIFLSKRPAFKVEKGH